MSIPMDHEGKPADSTPPLDPIMLERYLDGQLHGEERDAAERLINADPSMRSVVALQREIDRSLRAEFEPVPLVDLFPRTAEVKLPPPEPPESFPIQAARPASSRLTWLLGIAASLLVAAGGFSLYISNQFPAPSLRLTAPHAVYARLVESGFTPAFVCTTNPEFAKAVRDRFNQALLARPDPDLELVGWAYGDAYSERLLGEDTLVLMARFKGEPVIGLIDLHRNDRTMPPPPAESGLKVSKKRIGSLVVYEVSRDCSKLLSLLYDPDAPSDQK